jgi:hypothetical protein
MLGTARSTRVCDTGEIQKKRVGLELVSGCVPLKKVMDEAKERIAGKKKKKKLKAISEESKSPYPSGLRYPLAGEEPRTRVRKKRKKLRVQEEPVGIAKVKAPMPEVSCNPNEMRVLDALHAVRKPVTLGVLAEMAFPRLARSKGNSWVRNSLRKLVAHGLVEQVARGTYAMVKRR